MRAEAQRDLGPWRGPRGKGVPGRHGTCSRLLNLRQHSYSWLTGHVAAPQTCPEPGLTLGPHPLLRRSGQAPGQAVAGTLNPTGVTIKYDASGSRIQGLRGMKGLRVQFSLQPSTSCFRRALGQAQSPLGSPPGLAHTAPKGLWQRCNYGGAQSGMGLTGVASQRRQD